MSLSYRTHPGFSKDGRKQFLHLGDQYVARDHSNWSVARAYLLEERMLSSIIVDPLSEDGIIYADTQKPSPNLVFLHRNARKEVCGASICSTGNDPRPLSFQGEKDTAWFYIGDFLNAHTIAVVESPIDALSYYCLKGPAIAVVSCAGVVVPDELIFQVYAHQQSFIFALNNTVAGEHAWQKVWDNTADWTGFKISSDCPLQKDWNADLTRSRKIRSMKI